MIGAVAGPLGKRAVSWRPRKAGQRRPKSTRNPVAKTIVSFHHAFHLPWWQRGASRPSTMASFSELGRKHPTEPMRRMMPPLAVGHSCLYRHLAFSRQSQLMCVGTFDLAFVSPIVRSFSNSVRRTRPIVSACMGFSLSRGFYRRIPSGHRFNRGRSRVAARLRQAHRGRVRRSRGEHRRWHCRGGCRARPRTS